MRRYLFFLLLVTILGCNQQITKNPVDYVNVFTGTSNSRWMLFPGPTMPFGMVKLSPDNQSNVWNGGYEYTVNSISGFSHVHSWAMGGLNFMPVVSNDKTYPGPSDGPFGHMWTAGYRSRFSKNEEEGRPGYYKVRLYDYDIVTELTTTTRCGYSRMTYPEGKIPELLFNFNPEFEENAPSMQGAFYRIVNDREIEGYIKQKSSFADVYTVHFVARFNQSLVQFKSWENLPYDGPSLYGTDWQRETKWHIDTARTLEGDCGLMLQFEDTENGIIEMQTSISLVSIPQARLNMDTELSGFDWKFEAVVDNNMQTWNKLLGRIEVRDNNKTNLEKFYTNMYRAYAGRTIWNDVNGKYVDMCEDMRELPDNVKNIYGSDALWGAHWNLFPLWTLVTPEIASEWVNSLLEMYDRGGWLPQGPEGIEYCEVMVAAHQVKLIVSAYQKGIRDFDVEKAYEAVVKNQTIPGKHHECGGWVGNKNLESFLKYGYVANEDGPVSNTLEIAFDDWAVAQMAKSLGKEDDYRKFMQYAGYYKNIFDTNTKYMRQRHADGSWVQDWNPLENHGTWYGAGYVEGTAWHYSFFVPHDYPGLIELTGRDIFINRLQEGFENNYIDIGNQPNMQAPFIFNYAGRPALTQKYTREMLENSFNTSPLKGWPGEEDQGQLGAWFTLASMGLFQMKGGCSVKPYYDIGSPLFDEIVIHLDEKYYNGKTFTIKANNNSENNIYIQSAKLNGKSLDEPVVFHDELVKGGELILEMGSEPSVLWKK